MEISIEEIFKGVIDLIFKKVRVYWKKIYYNRLKKNIWFKVIVVWEIFW